MQAKLGNLSFKAKSASLVMLLVYEHCFLKGILVSGASHDGLKCEIY